jgi:hypothetical protein
MSHAESPPRAHEREKWKKSSKMPCVRSLPGVDATTVSVLEAAGMPTIEHVLAFAPSELRADPRVEQVRLPPLTVHPVLLCDERRPHPHRYTAKPTVNTPLPSMVFVSRLGFAAQEPQSWAALQAHRTRLGAQNCSRHDSTWGTQLSWWGGVWLGVCVPGTIGRTEGGKRCVVPLRLPVTEPWSERSLLCLQLLQPFASSSFGYRQPVCASLAGTMTPTACTGRCSAVELEGAHAAEGWWERGVYGELTLSW